MKYAPNSLRAVASALLLPLALSATGQMHRVAAPEKVTRAVGVYEYVGDLEHPKAARLIPVSLFIGGHFEDAGVYLARPIPFALDGGLRYELQRAGVRQDYLDVIASRNFTSSAAAAATPFDDGWFGYGRVSAPPPPKTARLRPNCGNARVVQETDNSKKDDGKPHFGSKPAADETKPSDPAKPASDDPRPQTRAGRTPAPDPCRDDDSDRPEKVSLAEDRDKNAPDPERPTLHRSPETSANNTGAAGKPDKKAPKPPPATITANGSPADDPDRPTIRHRTTDENDPNALPPDPIDLAGRERAQASAKAAQKGDTNAAPRPAAAAPAANDTVADNATISAGDTMSGKPVLRRGRLSAPPPEPSPSIAATKPAAAKPAMAAGNPASASASSIAQPLDAIVAVSDAKDRATHDFSYHFSSNTERAAALDMLHTTALAVLANPALASDAPEGAAKATAASTAATPAPKAATRSTSAHTSAMTHSTPASRARARATAAAPSTAPALADEQMNAYQLYFSAPVTYIYTARMPATATATERFVTVIAQTDAEGKLQPAMRSVTDATHLDRTPRYRLIDAVDADGSNRASLLMELRAQHTRQFALYRLLGNKPDQIFLSGSTLL